MPARLFLTPRKKRQNCLRASAALLTAISGHRFEFFRGFWRALVQRPPATIDSRVARTVPPGNRAFPRGRANGPAAFYPPEVLKRAEISCFDPAARTAGANTRPPLLIATSLAIAVQLGLHRRPEAWASRRIGGLSPGDYIPKAMSDRPRNGKGKGSPPAPRPWPLPSGPPSPISVLSIYLPFRLWPITKAAKISGGRELVRTGGDFCS